MSLETVSTKRGRVYQRAFDHEEAQKLRAEGWSYGRIAEHFGVSDRAVQRVCDPKVREDMERCTSEYHRRQRQPCKGGCGTLVWTHNKSHTGYCNACLKALQAAPDIRPDELRCTKCREWKPDAEFGTHRPVKARRSRCAWCRACEAAARRANRKANPERERATDINRKRKKAKTVAEFVVLAQNGNGLKEVARVEAVSRLHAVEQAATEPGEYVCVKADQLKPFKLAPVTRLSVVKDQPTERNPQ